MNGRAWTADDCAKLRMLARGGYTDGQIGEAMKRTRTCVQKRRNLLNVSQGEPRLYRAMMMRIAKRRKARGTDHG